MKNTVLKIQSLTISSSKMINRILSLERNFQSVKKSSEEKNLPIQIGWNSSVKKIDTFFERQDTRGYKFDIDSRGNVFIIEMEKDERGFVIKRLEKYFDVPNGGVVDNPPIDVGGSSAQYRPRGRGEPFARRAPPRISRHREIPPVNKTGRPHARIMCEIAVSQRYQSGNRGQYGWNPKCIRWMQQQYVRCVFGVKIYDPRATRNAVGQLHRCMIARLWTRQAAPIPERHIAVAGLPGVYYEEWNFGTHDYYTGALTACIGSGLINYQVNIPVQEVFWNPSIIGGSPSIAGYVIAVPGVVTAPNFIIDLYQIQQVVLQNQEN
ncbi:unnamed protein product [Rhizophagus irregularis]|nr:unnamed protein product [Rhizophagus irregularis]